jgi:S-adenosylmethionine-diacylgycerolhomoserine-N-methlytransferase
VNGSDSRRWFARYGVGARWYDAVSLEWPVYGVGRRAGIELLSLGEGDHVLDVGCGTGLSLPLLREGVGATGRVTGVDASGSMLEQARRRVSRHGWTNVNLVQADAGAAGGTRGADPWVERPVDAVLFTYSLSVIREWTAALDGAIACAGPSARIVVVDLALPAGGWGVPAALARLACAAGGSDPRRHPWTALSGRLARLDNRTYRRGHIHVVGGRRPGTRQPPVRVPAS